ncbi:hypothetical protein LshimejAT787_0102910 [Lyophyllum shimeji]|uniref:Uncharacterized protein n=1 Tax=Lyophyllum shimeji TaxID=47721 RepID=A0A9P3PDC6_LYOSH|nr:hypothetical protein LshimejAT787_0102910 [Lyophyllum shimeji]
MNSICILAGHLLRSPYCNCLGAILHALAVRDAWHSSPHTSVHPNLSRHINRRDNEMTTPVSIIYMMSSLLPAPKNPTTRSPDATSVSSSSLRLCMCGRWPQGHLPLGAARLRGRQEPLVVD